MYRGVQEKIIDLRRNYQGHHDSEEHICVAIRCESDLATCLYDFAQDAIVAKELIDFALPCKKRADAIVAINSAEGVAPTASAPGASAPILPLATPPSKKRLRKHDDCPDPSGAARLNLKTAQSIARNFFQFVERHHLQQHLSSMHAGQILVLSIFHSRLSWLKGKTISLKESDHYLLQKPEYTPASKVAGYTSPAHFRKQIQDSATQRIEPEMQAPHICCLCGEGFIDTASLRKHCGRKHHSWQEARKRAFWEAQQMDAIDKDITSPVD